MAHTRIRPFNTKATYPEQSLDNDLAQAVAARGTMVFLRGQVGQNLDTAEDVARADPAGQTAQALDNVERLLAEAGSEPAHICRIVVYLTDIRHREAVYRIMGARLRGVHYVSTGIVITGLARPSWVVELEVTAVIPEDEGR